ncbi:CD276 antigen homolog isoform X2 [Puntigrus tetrazona]|uniref:CD276 antigen homolog isoform X2 n=1 Tax=Puntigrus tetrazona TaxID=1606681 RepID=UPI001C8A762F|nr:CD276 antigen homolog isoform X2 [Puntigrus tetrazona]
MILRCCVVYLLLHLTVKVSLQDSPNRFDGVVGGSVILPCLYVNQQPSTDVFWRLNESVNVLNIINEKPSILNQKEIFKNRAKSFPSEYAKGNYSIKLKDLDFIHAGIYTCFLQESNEEKRMQLFIKEKPDKPTEKPEKPSERQKNSAMGTESLKIMEVLTALLGFTLHLL